MRPRYTVRYLGANIKTWCFDKSRRYRRQQITQAKNWGFEKLRDNDPFGFLDRYDIRHAATVTEECMQAGIEYTFSAADRNPGIENLVTPAQRAALLQRYDGNLNFAQKAIVSIGLGSNIGTIRNFLLDQVGFLRRSLPAGVRMQAFNGPEMDGFGPWNMYDEEFRLFAAGLGFEVPNGGFNFVGMEDLVRSNYAGFVDQAHNVWGEPWLGDSSHWYQYYGEYGLTLYPTPWQPERFKTVITEFGIELAVPNRASEFRMFPMRVIERYADAGYEVARPDGVYNVEEMFLHTPVDYRFIDLWENGDTRPLWNAGKYRRLIASLRDNRNHWETYSGVMMDTAIASSLRQIFSLLKSNRTRRR